MAPQPEPGGRPSITGQPPVPPRAGGADRGPERLRLTKNQVLARLRQDWGADDAIRVQALNMADMLST